MLKLLVTVPGGQTFDQSLSFRWPAESRVIQRSAKQTHIQVANVAKLLRVSGHPLLGQSQDFH